MNSKMVQVRLLVDSSVIKETLTRMGIGDKKKKILYPTCYLYPNMEDFYIVHFKELFLLTRKDGYNNLCEDDVERKNSIIYCLVQWGLIEVVDKEEIEPHGKFVFVLPHKDKHEWSIEHKFNQNGINFLTL